MTQTGGERGGDRLVNKAEERGESRGQGVVSGKLMETSPGS